MRDAGWLQLYAETNQEAADLHVQAFRIGEELSLPVMVCMDGFVLTHAVERVDVPEAAQVEPFLPPFTPRQVLDPDHPYSIGSLVGPEAFTEVRYLAHLAHLRAPEVVERVAREFGEQLGRDSGGLARPYRCEDAETVVIAMGSALGTIKDVVDAMRDDGVRVGVLGITSYRPFPFDVVREACLPASRVVVIDRALAPGIGGPVAADVGAALHSAVRRYSIIAGLGGRAITTASLCEVFDRAVHDRLDPLTFLDLDEHSVEAASGSALAKEAVR
jgi:pyruvate ferredoxin oxidoreductase alpha subunit